MSSNVNYVLVQDGKHTVYRQGGGAGVSVDYFFAPGPDVVLRWLANLGDYADGQWFDGGWCDAGILIDVDHRVLLLFTTAHNEVVYRAAMLQAYAATWPGWEIRWAYDGIADLMAYVGLDPATAFCDDRPDRTERNEFGPDDAVVAVVTVRGADGRVRLYGLNDNGAWRRWWMGPDLVEWVTAGPELPESVTNWPTAGLDLDPATRRAGLWSVKPLQGLQQRWAEVWPGWTLEFWGDDMSRQTIDGPGTLYGPITPEALTECRRHLAKRVEDSWFVRSTMLARGVSETELQMMYRLNFGGARNMLDANVTAEEMERITALIRG